MKPGLRESFLCFDDESYRPGFGLDRLRDENEFYERFLSVQLKALDSLEHKKRSLIHTLQIQGLSYRKCLEEGLIIPIVDDLGNEIG